MSNFYKKTNRDGSGKKKSQTNSNIVEQESNFFDRTKRDHTGRKKRRGN